MDTSRSFVLDAKGIRSLAIIGRMNRPHYKLSTSNLDFGWESPGALGLTPLLPVVPVSTSDTALASLARANPSGCGLPPVRQTDHKRRAIEAPQLRLGQAKIESLKHLMSARH